MQDRFSTPEEAARGDIPEEYARALSVAISPSEDEAIVLLGTNEPPDLYGYQVSCRRDADEWIPGEGSNLCLEGTLWDEAPKGAKAAVVSWKGEEHEVPVVDGFFQFVSWGRARREPRLKRFKY